MKKSEIKTETVSLAHKFEEMLIYIYSMYGLKSFTRAHELFKG